MAKSKLLKIKVGILFVEGKTDYQFYDRFISYLKSTNSDKNCKIYEIYNLQGIGKFSSKLRGKFRNEIRSKYPDTEYHIFLCYDLDVFKFSPKPPIDREKISKQLVDEDGVTKVYHIAAKDSIEDWFLFDIDGICENLHIERPKNIRGKNGEEKMNTLFRKKNKIYIKGDNSNDIVNSLDIGKIYEKTKDNLEKLEKFLFNS